jgi:hypothetical protein
MKSSRISELGTDYKFQITNTKKQINTNIEIPNPIGWSPPN